MSLTVACLRSPCVAFFLFNVCTVVLLFLDLGLPFVFSREVCQSIGFDPSGTESAVPHLPYSTLLSLVSRPPSTCLECLSAFEEGGMA